MVNRKKDSPLTYGYKKIARERGVEMKKKKFVEIVWLVAFLITVRMAFYYEVPEGQTPFNWGLVISTFLMAWFVLSFKIIGPKEIGVIIQLGKPIKTVESGPHIVFWPIYRLEKVTKNIIQMQFPGDPEDVFAGDDNERLPEGKYRAIRVTHQGGVSSNPKIPLDPLERSMTTSISLICSFRIKYYVKFIGVIGSLEEATRQIRDKMTQTAQEELAKRTVRDSIVNKDAVSASIMAAVKDRTEDWGIDIHDAYLERIIISRTLSQSLKNVPRADLDAEITRIAAKAERDAMNFKTEALAKRIKEEGITTAKAEELLLKAKAIGYKKIAKDLGIQEGQVVLAMDTLRKTLSGKVSYVAGSGGMADMLNLIPLIKTALAEKPDTDIEE